MSPDDARKLIADAIKNPAKYGIAGCSLCGGAIEVGGLFTPSDTFAKRIGQPKGKQRVIVYGLCLRCSKVPNVTDRVEAAMVKDMGVQ